MAGVFDGKSTVLKRFSYDMNQTAYRRFRGCGSIGGWEGRG